MPTAYGFTEFGGPETQTVMEVPMPTPGPAELLVAVRAAGVNPADWKIRQGLLRSVAVEPPAVLGTEVAGIVEAVGQDVEGFAVGDAVLGGVAPGSGAFAEYALVTAAKAAKKPTGVSFTDAAALPIAAATAYDGVRQLDLAPGQTLLINGIGGGVGVAAAQIARDLGLTVIGTGSPATSALTESLGAIHVVSGDGVADRVRQILPGGVDGVFDLVGGESLRALGPLAGDTSKVVSAADGASATELGGGPVRRSDSGQVLAAVARLVADGKLDPHVQDVVPLARAAEAMTAVESGHSRGKVVISVP